MEKQSYTITSPAYITETLHLSSTPVGLNIHFEGRGDACTVETVPPTLESPLSVSNEFLQELLDEGHIKLKPSNTEA